MLRRSIRGLGLAAALCTALVAPHAALARPPHDPGRLIAKHAERLGLSDETLASIGRVLDASRARNEGLEDEARRARGVLRERLETPSPDRAAVLEAASAVDAAMAGLHRNRLEAILEIHALLTPAQREELVRIREERRARRRGCASDLASLCAQAPPGADALRCLADRYATLSDSCRETIERLGKESRHRRFGPPEP
jgi:Spy/CpxP family protein refolding chaperone